MADPASNWPSEPAGARPPAAIGRAIQAASLADAIRDLVWIAHDDGSVAHVNRAWSEFTGLALEDALGNGWARVVHPDDAARCRDIMLAHAPSGEPYDVEFRLLRADGRYRWMLARAAPIPGPSSQQGLWAGTCVDIDDQKRSSQRISDARLRRLLDANVVGILISNNAGAILEANDAFLRTIGYTRADLESGAIDWRALTPPEWLPYDEAAIEALNARGMFEPFEKEYIRKDGTRVPVSLGGARLEDTADSQICYIVDLSEIRAAEEALRLSESRFKRLADADLIGIYTSKVGDDSILDANDEFLRMIGYARDEFAAASLRWDEMTPPEFKDASERARAELLQSGRFLPYEKDYYRKDGSRVPVLVGGARLEQSDEVVCYVLDLSDEQTVRRRLQDSERRYRILADALPQIVMLSGEDRRLIYVNRHYEAYTGISSSEIGARWREAIHPDDLAAVDEARATGGPYEVEYRLRRGSDGAYRWHFARCLKVPDGGGGSAWLATAMDIDDRRRAEDSLRFLEKAGSRLAQSLDLTTTFDTLLDLVVPEFGDWASLNLREEDGRIKTILVRHRDPAKAHLARELSGVYCMNPAHGKGSARVFATGEPHIVSHVSRDDIRGAINDPYFPVFEQMGFGSLIALPIFSGGEVIGSIGIVSDGDRRTYAPADLPGLEEIARRAGFAIQNASQYEREHRVAEILQQAALPRSLPAVEGFAFDAYYRAGRREALIGGDWYDVQLVADGRIVVSIGDVAGSGLDAAVLMGNLRQVIRGAAHVYADPMMMLDIADRMLRGDNEDAMVTAFVGVIDPARRQLLYASAGHLPALLRTSDGAVVELTASGLPLGVRDLSSGGSRTAPLPRGSSLLLYTDGLVEWSRNILEGEELLRRQFAAMRDTAQPNSAKALCDGVLPETGALDDVAVLTVAVR